MNFLTVALGGAIGAVLRYVFYIILNSYESFYITLIINVLGAFVIGLFYTHIINYNVNDLIIKLAMIGILGGFTTFSTFSLDVVNMLNNGNLNIAVIYILLSVVLCVFFTYIGMNFTGFFK